ncbi:hypothetical protein PCANB_002193 [Pneumocystis canis]|nr:hypothetical protein PCANB_002193 [Pneumocystis canis]
MESQIDGRADCLFFMNNSCNKGDLCIYRHNQLAKGSRIQCTEFQARQTCTRVGCTDRHLTSYIRETYCYWETMPSGCTKVICPFKHYGSGKQTILSGAKKDLVESSGNNVLGESSVQKKSQNVPLEIKEKNESLLSNGPTVHVNEITSLPLKGNSEVEQRKRKLEPVLLSSSSVSKKLEKSPLKDENVKVAPLLLKDVDLSITIPTAPKSQRNIPQSKVNIRGFKANHFKKQDKRGSSNIQEKDNIEFRVRTLEEIREEKAAKLREIEKNKKVVNEPSKEIEIVKESIDAPASINEFLTTHSKTPVNETKDVLEKIRSESHNSSLQEGLKQSKNPLTSNLKNTADSTLLPLSDDDLDFLNDNADKTIDIDAFQSINNDFEDDELAAFERELEM